MISTEHPSTGMSNISEIKSKLNLHYNDSHDGRRMCPVLLDAHVDGALIELKSLTASM